MENCDKVTVGSEISSIRIIASNQNNEAVIVPNEKLEWHHFDDSDDYEAFYDYLTLKEISEQLLKLGFKPVYYVWVEDPLSGIIYQYGNYPDNLHWIEHGKTKGYA